MKSKVKSVAPVEADPHQRLRDEIAQLQQYFFGDWRCQHDGAAEPHAVRQAMEVGRDAHRLSLTK